MKTNIIFLNPAGAHTKFLMKQKDTVNFYDQPISSLSNLVLNCEQVLEFQPLFKYDDV